MKQRIVSLQVIRAAAFLMIFLSHVELLSTGPVGVSLFLVLSGFCMTLAYLDRPERIPAPSLKNSLCFAYGKVKKLYPLHLITLLFVAAVLFVGLVKHRASAGKLTENLAYFAANAALLQSWIPVRDGYFSFNAVSWYLSTALFSYFVFPWVFPVIQKKQPRKIALLAAAAIGCMVCAAIALGIGQKYAGWSRAFLKWAVYIFPCYRAGDFITGLALGYVFLASGKKHGSAACTAAEVLSLAVLATQVYIYSRTDRATNWILTLFWLPTSCALICTFALSGGILSRTLSKSKFLVWIGDISGEAFLIHQICIKATETVLKNKLLVGAAAFALTLLCTVFWRFLYKKVRENGSMRRRESHHR